MNEVHRLAAFSADPGGGNPAGVVPDARGLSDREMLQIAADVGYSETAFLVDAGNGSYDVRYFSPLAEVPFCGHATIASGVLLGAGEWLFATRSGDVAVDVSRQDDGLVTATLTSVSPHVDDMADDDLAELLAALGWAAGDPDPRMPPRVAYAGAYHPILAVRERDRLSRLDYDVDRLRTLMLEPGLDDNRPGLARDGSRVPRPQPVSGRRGVRGSGDRSRGGRLRRVPQGARSGPAARDGDDPPGWRDGPAEHAAGGASRGRRAGAGERHGCPHPARGRLAPAAPPVNSFVVAGRIRDEDIALVRERSIERRGHRRDLQLGAGGGILKGLSIPRREALRST